MELRKIEIKKSGFEDTFFVIAVLLTIAIFMLILTKVWGEVKDPLAEGIQGSLPAGSGVNVSENFNNVQSTGILMSRLLPLIIIGLFAFVFIGTAIYFNNPIMIFIGIIILGVAIFLAIVYANIYQEISSSPEFSTANSQLGLQGKLIKALPYIVMIMFIFIIAAVLYTKRGGSGNY